jgi:hypothetical protein
MRTVESVRPGQVEPYVLGELGVVREHFARRYLVQAYRRLEGKPPLAAVGEWFAPEANLRAAVTAWKEVHRTLDGTDADPGTDRNIGDYQWITNCLTGAFTSATATARARAATYGANSPALRDWFKAQDAVFENCSRQEFVAPDPAPPDADALARADRAYQIAAAHFYAMRYDEAAARFRQIAADAASPWRPYGRYLVGRALLRQATTAKTLDRSKLLAAQEELRAAGADPDAAVLKASASGLLELIAFRVDPIERLRAVSAPLAGGQVVDVAGLTEYERLMDHLLGDTTTIGFNDLPSREAIARTSELNDWILTMQGGPEAGAHAIAQWKRAGSTTWLVAALWKVPAAHSDAPALLQAAARVPTSSPAFMTTAFLRTRLLAARGETREARAVLATLPRTTRDRAQAEAVNLLNAMRFRLASSLDELLEAAPRMIVSESLDSWRSSSRLSNETSAPHERQSVFDEDAGAVFSRRMPLARLVDASTSKALPARLRLRVAAAAFARAWLLKRDDAALAVAPVLRELSPAAAADVRAYETATPADRHIAGLRLLLRTPGMHATVRGVEDDQDYVQKGLSRTFDHTFRRNWWCAIPATSDKFPPVESGLPALLDAAESVAYPAFLSADDRAAVERELASLAALGPAPNYLAAEAVAWAKSRPADRNAAEALALAVEGTRWGCGDDTTTRASRAAFQTLHQLFPRSEWARRTKYWY